MAVGGTLDAVSVVPTLSLESKLAGSEYDGIVEKTGIGSLIDALNRKTAGFAE
jgi:hypothetical protein